MTNKTRLYLALAAALLGLALLYAVARHDIAWTTTILTANFFGHDKSDFGAFYCGASVLSGGHDPYRYEPLHSCEFRTLGVLWTFPNPLPPYAIAAFIPLSRLDFTSASFAWLVVIMGSAFAVTWILAKLSKLSPPLVAICTLPALLVVPLQTGALAPVAIALLCASAAAIANERLTFGAILLGCACIEPHVALPAVAGVFILRPAMRVPLGIVIVFIVLASIIPGGLTLNREYLSTVLPAHAVSELGAQFQYSFSSALYLLGVPERGALYAGAAQYSIFVAAGILVARALRGRVAGAEVFAPIAFAVGGGTFVHIVQIAAALPFALLLAAQAGTVQSWFAVALLDVPWYSIFDQFQGQSPGPPPPAPAGALAEVGWRSFLSQFSVTPLWWPEHLPVYLGLALLYVTAVQMAFRSRQLRMTFAASQD